ncbi:MAG: hypothetical protein U9N60_04945 [Thermodesulfobacteriota bacterium]|nr:hypothetical protein [Thermodesulfobacteriota bacterium]
MCELSLHSSIKQFTKIIRVILALLLLSGVGCTNKQNSSKTSFHPLPDLAFVQTAKDYNGNSYSVRNEFVVIANPPAQQEKLQRLVDAYNKRTLSTQQLVLHFGHIRRFYKESAAMPWDYKESDKGYFEKDRWEHHGGDLLFVVKWGEFGKEVSYEFP